MSRSLLPSLLVLALVPLALACGSDSDDDEDDDHKDHHHTDEGNGPYCEDTALPLASGEAGPTGVSADELLAAIPAELLGSIHFEDDVESSLEVEILVDADSVRHITSEAVYPPTDGPTDDIGVVCDDRVEVDAVVSLHSEEGRLAESLELVLYAPAYEDGAQPGTAEVILLGSQALDPDALEGSLDLAELHDLSEFDEVSMYLSLEIVGPELFGVLDGTGSGSDENAAWASSLPVASFEASDVDAELPET